ncbi:MAG TPA: ACT domain-containing protein [Minicystis sp.]|nr:ACT domain-containing protein [Minicystis sp.]
MASPSYAVLTALGPDRPGLVAETTHFLTDRGLNVEDSRMAVLGGEFGIMMLVSGTPEELARVEKEAGELGARANLAVLIRRTKSPEEHRRAAAVPCLVVAEALDHEGIVRAIASALHEVGVNIVSLDTSAYEAPVTGSPLFRLEARVDVPPGLTVARVRAAMARVADVENLDIDVRSLVARH